MEARFFIRRLVAKKYFIFYPGIARYSPVFFSYFQIIADFSGWVFHGLSRRSARQDGLHAREGNFFPRQFETVALKRAQFIEVMVHRADGGKGAIQAEFFLHARVGLHVAEAFNKKPVLDLVLLFGGESMPEGVGTEFAHGSG